MAILKPKKVNMTQEQLLGQTILLGIEPVIVKVKNEETNRWEPTNDVRLVNVRVLSVTQMCEVTIPIELRDYNTNELKVPQETYQKILKLVDNVITDVNILVEFVGFETEVANETTLRENYNAGANDDKIIRTTAAGYKMKAKDLNLKPSK